MEEIKPAFQTLLATSIPLVLSNINPILGFLTAIFGACYMFFKAHRSYFIWRNIMKKRNKND